MEFLNSQRIIAAAPFGNKWLERQGTESGKGMGSVEELAGELLKRGGCLRLKARGGSMIPSLLDGDLVLVVPTEGRTIVVGDVICYETSPERLFLHRVIGRDGERFVAKGDALAYSEVVFPSKVLGKAVVIERHGRIRRLDSRPAQWMSRAMVFASPFISGLLPLALRVRRTWKAALCA